MPELTPEELDKELDALEDDLDADEATADELEEELPPATNNTQLDMLKLDEPIYDGGPTRTEVEDFKKKYPTSKILCLLLADGYGVLYRTLTRREWKAIQEIIAKEPDTDKREELVFSKIVLHPAVSDRSVIGDMPAGVIISVMQEFYEHCGFTAISRSMVL